MNLSLDLHKMYSVHTVSIYFAKFKYDGIYELFNVSKIWHEERGHELKGQRLELTW